MIEQRPFRAAGIAMLWQSFQMGGVKIIYMVRLLVLAILLSPDDFGLFAIALTATSFLPNLTNLGLVPALVQAEKTDETKYDAVWTVEFIRLLLITALTVAFAPIIATIFAEPRAVTIIQLLALRPLMEAMISIKVAALNRNLAFRPLAFLKIIEAVFNATISIALAKTIGVWAMVFGTMGGAVAMVIASYILAPYRPRLVFNREAVQPLLKFGRWILATGLVAMAGSYGLRIVISRELGAEGLGIFFLAAQLAFLPSEVASEVVGSVAFPLFARLQTNLKQAARAFQTILTGLMALLYPICGLIIVLAPVLVQNVLGEKWSETAPIIQILALVTMIGIFSDATVPLVKGLGQPYRVTQIELVQSSALLLLVWLMTSRYGIIGAALSWLPAIILVQILCMFFIRKIFMNVMKEIAKPFLAIFFSTLAGALLSALIISVLPNITGLVFAGLTGVFVTGLLIWLSDRRFSLGFALIIATTFPQAAPFLRIQKAEIR
jgi:lipopolysaccharide exporter